MEQESDSYYLKWNHFQLNICSTLENFHMSEDFVDVTLYCEGISLKAHKVILSACSSYFRTVFKDHQLCPHPVIILKGIALEDLTALLTFMYQGEVNIARHRLSEFIQTARLLQIRGLCDNIDVEEQQECIPKQTFTEHLVDNDAKKRKFKYMHGEQKLSQNDGTECSKCKQIKTTNKNEHKSFDSSESTSEDIFKDQFQNTDVRINTEKKEFDNNKNYEKMVELSEKVIKNESRSLLSSNDSYTSDNENMEHSVVQDDSSDININDTSKFSISLKSSEIYKSNKIDNKEDINQNTNRIEEYSNITLDKTISQDIIDGGSILQRSLTGDHTVKPAESLVITPDLPISDSTLLPTIKREPDDLLNISEPPPLVPLKVTKSYLKPSVSPYSQILKDRLSPLASVSTNMSVDSKQNCSDFSEVNLTKTLKILKNNPHISVLSEKKTEIDSKEKTPEILIKLVSQTSSYKTIGLNKMDQKNDPNQSRKNSKQDSALVQNPILAQNLIQTQNSLTNFSQQSLKLKNQRHVTSPSVSIAPSHKFNIAANQNMLQKHSTSINQNTAHVPTLEHILTQVQTGQGQTSSHTLMWNCPHCKQEYHNQSALKYHVRLVHSDFTNRLCCYLCPTSFTMRESYKAHMLEAHGIRN